MSFPFLTAVEDPSEAFEDLRDKADLYTLISSGEFDNLKAPLDKKITEPLRKKFKLANVRTAASARLMFRQ
jgi:histone acetyltransferase 1